jgi:hypothetical protein
VISGCAAAIAFACSSVGDWSSSPKLAITGHFGFSLMKFGIPPP